MNLFSNKKHDSLADSERPVGLLAGWGTYPRAVAEALHAQGRQVAGVGIHDHADPRLADLCQQFDWIGLGGIGRAIRLFKRWGVREAVMAGKVHKVLLYQPGWWLKHRPDWTCIKAFSPQLIWGRSDRKDDTLLSTIVEAFARQGIDFQSITQFAPELLVQSGLLTGKPLTSKQQKDVAFGWQIAKAMGGLDIGQTICIKNQTVIAVEAIEGTDLCIRRAGELCGGGRITVVKVAKPHQDMRFDVPTVGIKTLESIATAGGGVLAIEAEKTILLERTEFLPTARRLGISVVAREEKTLSNAAA